MCGSAFCIFLTRTLWPCATITAVHEKTECPWRICIDCSGRGASLLQVRTGLSPAAWLWSCVLCHGVALLRAMRWPQDGNSMAQGVYMTNTSRNHSLSHHVPESLFLPKPWEVEKHLLQPPVRNRSSMEWNDSSRLVGTELTAWPEDPEGDADQGRCANCSKKNKNPQQESAKRVEFWTDTTVFPISSMLRKWLSNCLHFLSTLLNNACLS